MAVYITPWCSADADTQFTLDADGEQNGVTFVPDVSGTLDTFYVYVSLASSVQNLVTTLHSVAADGTPGTTIATSAAWTPTASTWETVSIGGAVTAGTKYWLVHNWDSTAGNVRLVMCADTVNTRTCYIHAGQNTGGGWSGVDGAPTVPLKYADGTYHVPPGCAGFVDGGSLSMLQSAGEFGYKFVPVYDSSFVGCYLNLDATGANTDFDLTLYDSDGTTVLAQQNIVNGHIGGLALTESSEFYFGGVALTAGSTYYVASVGHATSAGGVSNAVSFPTGVTDAVMAAQFGITSGSPVHRTYANRGAGAWTDPWSTYPRLVPMLDTINPSVSSSIYHADVLYTRDTTSGTDRDEVTCCWYKNGIPQTGGMTSPTVQIIRRSDGADLLAETAMSEAGSTGIFTYDAGSHLITPGEAAVIVVGVTLDGATHSFCRVVSRDV